MCIVSIVTTGCEQKVNIAHPKLYRCYFWVLKRSGGVSDLRRSFYSTTPATYFRPSTLSPTEINNVYIYDAGLWDGLIFRKHCAWMLDQSLLHGKVNLHPSSFWWIKINNRKHVQMVKLLCFSSWLLWVIAALVSGNSLRPLSVCDGLKVLISP